MSHNFRGQRRTRVQRRKKWSQDATRNPIIMEDQHGRQWSASTEMRSGHPTGHIQALFSAPWFPYQKYFVINPDNVAELYIDYEAMYADAKSANANYHKRAIRASSKKGWPTPIRGEYSEDVTEALGEPPSPIQPIVAAYQNNRYILGSCEGCKRASNTCVCAQGYRVPKPDPRLIQYMIRRREELEEVTEGLDFSEASRQRALRDAGLKEVKVNGRRMLTDIENDASLDFTGDDVVEEIDTIGDDLRASEEQLGAPPLGGVASIDDDSYEARDAADDGDSIEQSQTAALEGMVDGASPMDELQRLEDEVDAGGLGGRTIPPQKADVAERQAPRPATQTATRSRQGAHRSRVGAGKRRSEMPEHNKPTTLKSLRDKKDTRKSLADGAKPAVGAGAFSGSEE